MILLVDDQPSNIDILIEIIADNADAAVALSGDEALEIVAEEKPDLILLDIVMPDMDGFEVCRRLKSEDQWKDIPVVFLSGNSSDEDISRGKDLGAVDFLEKPIDPKKVLDVISRYSG